MSVDEPVRSDAKDGILTLTLDLTENGFSPSSSNAQCYTPDGGPKDAWRPVISSVEHQGLSSQPSIIC